MADLHSSTPKIARFAFCAQVAAEASVLLCNCYVTGVSSFGRAQVLLLEANIDQAKKAGAAQAVEVMTMLKDKAGKSPRTIQPEWASCPPADLRSGGRAARGMWNGEVAQLFS